MWERITFNVRGYFYFIRIMFYDEGRIISLTGLQIVSNFDRHRNCHKLNKLDCFMWIDWEAYSPAEAKLAVGPLHRTSSVFFPSSSFITYSGVVLYDSYDSKLSHPPSLYCISIFLFPALGTSSLRELVCMQSDALDPDLQPQQLYSSIPKHAETLTLSLIADARLNTMIPMCKTPRFD
jgi:hypothetical protein